MAVTGQQPPTRAMNHADYCAVNECGKPYYAKALCRKHWERQHRNGTVELKISDRESTIAERLDALQITNGECNEFGGYRNANGYGELTYRGRLTLAHRASYERHNGPIPDGMIVCHRCDNPPCINPDHLYVGTHADNGQDKAERRRSTRGVRNAAAKLTDDDVLTIRRLRVDGWTYARLGDRFGVGKTTIGRVVRRAIWNHVKEVG